MPSDFFFSTLPLVGVIGVSVATSFYAAYLALSVWRGLAVPIYKSRAMWTAFLAILFGLAVIFSGNVDAIFPEAYRAAASLVIYFALYTLALVVLYVWIDRTISTVIRLDYLRRDLLGWRKFRFVYWSLALVSLVWGALYNPSASLTFTIAYLIVLLVPFAYASMALVVGSRRTLDMTFRSYARWGGYCMLATILAALVYFVTPNVFLEDLPVLLIAYTLYKMAKFLVPVGTLTG